MALINDLGSLAGIAYFRLWMVNRDAAAWMRSRIIKDESGEGVISAAIAVLIMAFLGVALWVAFSNLLSTTTTKVTSQVNQIGG